MKEVRLSERKIKGMYFIELAFSFDKILHRQLMDLGCEYDSKTKTYLILNSPKNYHKIIQNLESKYKLNTYELRKHFLERSIDKKPRASNMDLTIEAQELQLQFEKYMLANRYSHQTVQSYLFSTQQLFGYFSDKSPLQLSNADINEYIFSHFIPKGYSNSSQRQLIAAIKLFYSNITGTEIVFDKIEYPRKEFNLPKLLSVEEIRQMIEASINLKHKTILMVLYGTGIRMAELLNLRIKDIDSKNQIIHITKGKGNKDRIVQMNDILLSQLRIYYRAYRPKVYLFEGVGGKQYSSSSVNATLRQAASRAGINKRVSAHMIRHSYATHMMDKGVGIRHIQVLLGHQSSKTTEIYTHVSRKGIQDLGNPLDDFRIFVSEPNNNKNNKPTDNPPNLGVIE
jgi:site-specific recombinase XerD